MDEFRSGNRNNGSRIGVLFGDFFGDGLVSLILAIGSLALYLKTMAPTVWYGNSAAHQYGCYILGVLYPTGYPLYTLLGKLFTFIPVGDIAYRVNLLSASATALAVSLVYLSVRQVIKPRAPAILAALCLAVSHTFWSGAVVARVYALNIFFVALTLYLLLRWGGLREEQEAKHPRWLTLFALAYGLSLTHHRMILLLLPAYVVFYFLTAGLTFKRLLVPALAGLLPLLLYLYIPLRGGVLLAQADPANLNLYPSLPEAVLRGKVTAHYHHSLEGFINVVTGREYAYYLHIYSLAHFFERLGFWVDSQFAQFGPLGLLVGAVGAFRLTVIRRKTSALLWLAYLGVMAYGLPLVGHEEPQFYFLPAFLIFAIWMGVGMNWLWSLLAARQRVINVAKGYQVPYVFYYLLWAVVPLGLLYRNYPELDMSQDYSAATYAQQVLTRPLEEKAVLLGPSGLTAAIRYFQYTANQRPDLLVISANPTSKGGRKLFNNCLEAGRPLYLLDFPLEASKLAFPPHGLVQMIPIPLYQEAPPQFPLSVDFEDKIRLLGYDLDSNVVEKSGAFHLTLYWQALSEMERNYHLFVHLVGPNGQGWGQVDKQPLSILYSDLSRQLNYYPTSRWKVGQTFKDEYWLPLAPEAPSGTYHLELGLYFQETMERLNVLDPRWTEADAITIKSLEGQ